MSSALLREGFRDPAAVFWCGKTREEAGSGRRREMGTDGGGLLEHLETA